MGLCSDITGMAKAYVVEARETMKAANKEITAKEKKMDRNNYGTFTKSFEGQGLDSWKAERDQWNRERDDARTVLYQAFSTLQQSLGKCKE